MKIGLLSFSNSSNIGDEIQTLAVAQHLSKQQDTVYVDRDFMNTYAGEPCVVVMNGWFSSVPKNFPPSSLITPFFFGFHIAAETVDAYKAHASYFKQHEPIGCRDQGTCDIVKSWGVNAYVSGCATMTFPTRPLTSEPNARVAVDVGKRKFLKKERSQITFITHKTHFQKLSRQTKFSIARDLLDFYRTEAKLVITSKIHCALPCTAMGVPVVYVGKKNYRTNIVSTIGVPLFKQGIIGSLIGNLSFAAMPFKTPSFEERKQVITKDLRARLAAAGAQVAE